MGGKINTDKHTVEELLTRFVSEVIDKESLRATLLSGKKLRIKLGIDPTSPHIHLGRAVLLLKLRAFQSLGHTAVFIVGDATGVIGDTSDKDSERPMLTKDAVAKNAETYLEQASKLIDLNQAEVHHNSEWLNTLTYKEIGEHASLFSVADFIARDNIKRRLEGGTRVSLREVLYPLMQGYDSVAVSADVEIGGTDQRFNLLAGRTLQEHHNQPPQNILMTKLIPGTDGRKMSSSWGNTITVVDEPGDMYGKVMRVPDDLVETYFTACTLLPVESIKEAISLHPRDAKMRLAREITALYHGETNAKIAEEHFVKTFQEGAFPEAAQETTISGGSLLVDVLLENGVVSSRSEARRLINERAITDGQIPITEIDHVLLKDAELKIGKKRFLRVRIKRE
jgi:tyrosyl-tRNA synthetase